MPDDHAGMAVDCREVVFSRQGPGGFRLVLPELRAARGERLFVHGPSGSGKSTLLALIGGTLVPASGQISVLGQDITQMSGARRDRFRAANIGFIFQLFNLIPYLSAAENIALACRFSHERAARLTQALDVEIASLGERLDLDSALLGRPAAELSVGQQQRVAAARALIGRPPLLIADEPTSALDENRQQAFLQLLMAEAGASGATLLFVSHDRRLATAFDRTVALGGGAC